MVLEDGNIDEDVGIAGENLRQAAAYSAVCSQVLFVIDAVGAEALHAISANREMESGAFHFVAVAVPDDDVSGLDSGLLQAFADGFDELEVGGDTAPSEGVHLESNTVTGAGQPPPRGKRSLGRVVVVKQRQHGAIEQGLDAAGVHRGADAAQHGIVGDNNPGFCGGRLLSRSRQAGT